MKAFAVKTRKMDPEAPGPKNCGKTGDQDSGSSLRQNPKAQNRPKALHKMIFGPRKLTETYESLEPEGVVGMLPDSCVGWR